MLAYRSSEIDLANQFAVSTKQLLVSPDRIAFGRGPSWLLSVEVPLYISVQ